MEIMLVSEWRKGRRQKGGIAPPEAVQKDVMKQSAGIGRHGRVNQSVPKRTVERAEDDVSHDGGIMIKVEEILSDE